MKYLLINTEEGYISDIYDEPIDFNNSIHTLVEYSGGAQISNTVGTSPEDDFILEGASLVPVGYEANELARQAAQDSYDALQYARDRQLEYPPIGDQLDALFHAGVFPTEIAVVIQSVKDKYPKG